MIKGYAPRISELDLGRHHMEYNKSGFHDPDRMYPGDPSPAEIEQCIRKLRDPRYLDPSYSMLSYSNRWRNISRERNTFWDSSTPFLSHHVETSTSSNKPRMTDGSWWRRNIMEGYSSCSPEKNAGKYLRKKLEPIRPKSEEPTGNAQLMEEPDQRPVTDDLNFQRSFFDNRVFRDPVCYVRDRRKMAAKTKPGVKYLTLPARRSPICVIYQPDSYIDTSAITGDKFFKISRRRVAKGLMIGIVPATLNAQPATKTENKPSSKQPVFLKPIDDDTTGTSPENGVSTEKLTDDDEETIEATASTPENGGDALNDGDKKIVNKTVTAETGYEAATTATNGPERLDTSETRVQQLPETNERRISGGSSTAEIMNASVERSGGGVANDRKCRKRTIAKKLKSDKAKVLNTKHDTGSVRAKNRRETKSKSCPPSDIKNSSAFHMSAAAAAACRPIDELTKDNKPSKEEIQTRHVIADADSYDPANRSVPYGKRVNNVDLFDQTDPETRTPEVERSNSEEVATSTADVQGGTSFRSVLRKLPRDSNRKKFVQFGEELELVRVVTKIEYPWNKHKKSKNVAPESDT